MFFKGDVRDLVIRSRIWVVIRRRGRRRMSWVCMMTGWFWGIGSWIREGE
jgi:hypothetical protein